MKRSWPFHSNAVWPPAALVALFVIAYGVVDGGLWVIARAAGDLKGEIFEMTEIRNVRALILGAAAGCYALYRLWRFHPACNRRYAAWLASSPWTPEKPLPLGPIYPVWQDAAVLGIITAVAHWHAHISATLPTMVFGLVFLVAMTLLLAFTRTWIPCLLLGVLWPSPSLPSLRGLPTIGIIAALIAVIWYGHRKCLAAFPWSRNDLKHPNSTAGNEVKSLMELEIRIPVLTNTPSARTLNAGWPFFWLSPNIECNSISVSTSFFVSALAGWWTYCAIVGFQMPFSPGAILFLALPGALLRLVVYCTGLSPSFNLWGRFASGRIIVPGFDRVFVTSLSAVALATAFGVVIWYSGSWNPVASAFAIASTCFLLLSGGPTMQNWVLTGQHRYRSPSKLGANRQLLRPI